MPNWKKLLVSGSNAELNSLKVSTSLTASGLHYPASDGLSGQFIQTDGSGSLSFISLGNIISGSIFNYTGSFSGDGSSLTNITVSEVFTVTASFSATSSITVIHNFNTKNVIVSAYDSSDFYFVPNQVKLLDNNRVKLSFTSPSTGHIVVAKGGHFVSGTVNIAGPQGIQGIQGIQGATGAQGNQGFQGPIREVSEVSTVSASFSATSSITVTHNFNSKSVVVSAYDSDDFYFVPETLKLIDNNRVKLTFSNASTGHIVVAKGGHLVSGSLYIAGPQGTQGATGAQGNQGTTGTQGTQGTVGAQGTQGTVGAQGATGAQGTQGTQGAQGIQGTQGTQGTSGTLLSIFNEEFINTISSTLTFTKNSGVLPTSNLEASVQVYQNGQKLFTNQYTVTPPNLIIIDIDTYYEGSSYSIFATLIN